jgi:glycogen debranching enzyme
LYLSDRRLVSRLEVRVGGVEATPISGGSTEADAAHFVGVVRNLGVGLDPAITLERRRYLVDGGMRELLRLNNAGRTKITTDVTMAVGGDLLAMAAVKDGTTAPVLPARMVADALTWDGESGSVHCTVAPRPDETAVDAGFRWHVMLSPGESWEAALHVHSDGDRKAVFTGRTQDAGVPWEAPVISAGDQQMAALVATALADLEALLMADPLQPDDLFTGAGSPWFVTLFGRDAIWAARFLLPLGTDLARGTLRTLARRQGVVVDATREEEPGKILHEIRRLDQSEDLELPPVYYGSVDSTPLWICLLADAWRGGMSRLDVEALLPNLESALAWMRDYGDADGDGFLEYAPRNPLGLANQGWKDSHDSVQWSDGRLAEAPIALCEVQGYAHEAAVKGADLLEAFGRPGADMWRDWAETLRKRFRGEFWVEDASGPFPAIALDCDKKPVDAVASNMGHLLATGLLDREECEHVASRLAGPDMDCGWGLRTMSASSPRFNPLGYHAGSVWPHDTAIAILGLMQTGHHEVAARLASGLIAAADHFDYRLPELFGGYQRAAGERPVPYPAACRPQAWAAASAIAILSVRATTPSD